MRRRPFPTALVGPSALLREGLARILGAEDFRIIASGSHVRDIAPTSQQQSVLLVIDSCDSPDAAAAEIELFKEQYPSGRVAVLTDHYQSSDMVSAFRAGANAYFAKFVNCDAFIKTLELVMLGETILPPQLLALIGDHDHGREYPSTPIDRRTHRDASSPSGINDAPRLSTREKSILRCMVEGHSNKVIAHKIEIAEATVKVHVKAILRKTRVLNRTQAAIWAMNNSSSIWPADPCPPSMMDVPTPPPLAPNGSGELSVPTDHGNPVNTTTTANINSAIRKSVERKKIKVHDRVVGS